MTLKLYNETDIEAIADAIRGKNGSSNTYTVSQMASAIDGIPSGGGGGSEINLLETITISDPVRAINIDLTRFSDYNIVLGVLDVELASADWLYYVHDASEPTGGQYSVGSFKTHKGVGFFKLKTSGTQTGNAYGWVNGASYNITPSSSTPWNNILIYAYNANNTIATGSTIKIYGGVI